MAIIVQCPHCGQRYQLRDDLAGMQAKCKCGNVLPIPTAPAPADSGLAGLLQQDAPSSAPLSQQPPLQGAGGGFVSPQFQGFPAANQTAQSNTKLWLWLAIGGGAGVLLILVVVIVWRLLPGASDTPRSPQQASGQIGDGAGGANPSQPVGNGPTLPKFASLNDVRKFEISRDGKLIAFLVGNPDRGGNLVIWDVARDEPLRSIEKPKDLRDFAFSSDGRFLGAASSRYEGRIFDVSSGAAKFDTKWQTANICGPVAFSPDNKAFYCMLARSIAAVDMETSAVSHIPILDLVPLDSPDLLTQNDIPLLGAFSPTEPTAAVSFFVRQRKAIEVRIYNLATKERTKAFDITENTTQLKFSPDGSVFVAALRNGHLGVWNAKTWEKKAEFVGSGKLGYNDIAVSPDNKLLVTRPSYEGRPVPEVWNLDTQQRHNLPAEYWHWTSLAFLPDGTLMALVPGNGTIDLVDPITGQKRVPGSPKR